MFNSKVPTPYLIMGLIALWIAVNFVPLLFGISGVDCNKPMKRLDLIFQGHIVGCFLIEPLRDN